MVFSRAGPEMDGTIRGSEKPGTPTVRQVVVLDQLKCGIRHAIIGGKVEMVSKTIACV